MLKLSLFLLLFFHLSFQKFTIVGSVRDTTGRAVPGVRVLVLDENFQPIRTIFVDSSGQFFVRGLSPGRYQFNVDTTGTPYQEQGTGWIELQALRVRGAGVEQYPLEFVLKPKPNKEVPKAGALVFAQEVPAPARSEYDRGVKFLREGKAEAGLTALKKAVELFPNYFAALEALGTEYVKLGQLDAALPLLRQALRLNNRASKSYYSLGVAYLKLNQLTEAIENLGQSATLEPNNINTQMMLGIACSGQQQFKPAEEAFQKALKLGGAAAAEAHFYLASVYEKQQQYDAAIAALEMYLKEAKAVRDPKKVKEWLQRLKQRKQQKSSFSGTGTR